MFMLSWPLLGVQMINKDQGMTDNRVSSMLSARSGRPTDLGEGHAGGGLAVHELPHGGLLRVVRLRRVARRRPDALQQHT